MATEEVAKWIDGDLHVENVVLMDDFGKSHEVQIRPGSDRDAILTAEKARMDVEAAAFAAFAQAGGYDLTVLQSEGSAKKLKRAAGDNGAGLESVSTGPGPVPALGSPAE
jgi:hypothetical protein